MLHCDMAMRVALSHALLGRFLPRLGRTTCAAFFFANADYSAEAYRAVFLVLALGLAASLIPYTRAIDPHPSKRHGSHASE